MTGKTCSINSRFYFFDACYKRPASVKLGGLAYFTTQTKRPELTIPKGTIQKRFLNNQFIVIINLPKIYSQAISNGHF